MARPSAQPPISLGPVGSDKWLQLEPKLRDRGAFALDQLLVYCRAFERWSAAQESIEVPQETLRVKAERGVITRTTPPARLVAADLEKAMRDAASFLEERMSN